MKVLLLSDAESLGGAAQSACRLAEGLARDHEVRRVVCVPDGKPHPWRTHVLGHESPLSRLVLRLPRKVSPDRFPRPNTAAFVRHGLRRLLEKIRPDVINVHNLHGASAWGWGPHLIEVCAAFAPVVWTLHDMGSFTGRCAYSYDCPRFRTGCDAACPTPHEAPRLEPKRIAEAWEERRRLLARHSGLVAVTPSRWLAAQALSGMWDGHRVDVIPYGIPTDVFAPVPRAVARVRLGLPADAAILLLAAFDVTERRKGSEIIPGFVERFCASAGVNPGARRAMIVTMGHGQLPAFSTDIAVRSLGWVDDDETKALAYSAADVLLHPAPVDNFPNVLLEAFACGTPAVGLPVGGVPEMIRPGITGWLARSADGAALADAAAAALRGDNRRAACRAVAVNEFPLDRQAERYGRLFEELLSGRSCRTMKRESQPVP